METIQRSDVGLQMQDVVAIARGQVTLLAARYQRGIPVAPDDFSRLGAWILRHTGRCVQGRAGFVLPRLRSSGRKTLSCATAE
jgi:hypothetical protein